MVSFTFASMSCYYQYNESDNDRRGGTDIIQKESNSTIVFTQEIHKNEAYCKFASELMRKLVHWEDGFRRTQQQK